MGGKEHTFVHNPEVHPVTDLVRIGDKVIDRARLHRLIDQALDLRAGGASQQEVADRLGTDRTFVSRLETLGELRRGRRIGLVGFPVANKGELEALAAAEGLDWVLLMTDAERWAYVRNRSGIDLVNDIMALISQAQELDAVIVLGSDMRVQLLEAVLGRKAVGMVIGASPIQGDRPVDTDRLRELIRALKASENGPGPARGE
ncbi:MAG: transcriptional regulator [Firmicutes bacterium]|jgi:hypothetical protein|nr:transcriptional regulator [Bacillota bacterium]MBO2518856.1 transcriptional regulator [Bacillota bacterium]NMA72007.1 transcriptional regulator [Bacillota bacterium]